MGTLGRNGPGGSRNPALAFPWQRVAGAPPEDQESGVRRAGEPEDLDHEALAHRRVGEGRGHARLHGPVRRQEAHDGAVRSGAGEGVLQGDVEDADHQDGEHALHLAAENRSEYHAERAVGEGGAEQRGGQHEGLPGGPSEAGGDRRVRGDGGADQRERGELGEDEVISRVSRHGQAAVERPAREGGGEHHEPGDQRDRVQRTGDLGEVVPRRGQDRSRRTQPERCAFVRDGHVGEPDPHGDVRDHQQHREPVAGMPDQRVPGRRGEEGPVLPHAVAPARGS